MPRNQHKAENDYVFAPTLVKYLEDRLHIWEKMNKIKNAGGEISPHLKKEDSNLDKRKMDILRLHIFRPMANLVKFFEYLANYPQLRDLFEDDLKELFGFNRGYLLEETTDEESRKAFNDKYLILARFLESLLTWDKQSDTNNFRLTLLNQLQVIVQNNVVELVNTHKLLSRATFNIVLPDMQRALTWTKLLSSIYEESEFETDMKQKPSRPVKF